VAQRADRRQRGDPDQRRSVRRRLCGSWAIANLAGLGAIGAHILDAFFMLCGLAVMVQFLRAAHRVEPFTAD